MSCDICGKNDRALVDLLEGYKTDAIKQICPDCEKAINKHLSKLRTVTHNILITLMKRFMQASKEQKS